MKEECYDSNASIGVSLWQQCAPGPRESCIGYIKIGNNDLQKQFSFRINQTSIGPANRFNFFPTFRFNFNTDKWQKSGAALNYPRHPVHAHPKSPSLGAVWMCEPVSFKKLKLTNQPRKRSFDDNVQVNYLTSLQKMKIRVSNHPDFKKVNHCFVICFILVSNQHHCNTWLAYKTTYTLPSTRTNYDLFNVRFCGPKLWNSIDESLKHLHKSSFKVKLKQQFLSAYYFFSY